MNLDKAITHGGKFHADDVFSSALLTILNGDIQIIRQFQIPSDFDGIAFDVGFGCFDHHQKEREIRKNGIPYAAFGLLWREFGERLLDAEDAVFFDERFVQPLDEDDNTGCGHPLADAIDAFNPGWDSDAARDDCFFEAVSFARTLLEKKFESIKSIRRGQRIVEEAANNAQNKIVVLPKYVPWKRALAKTEAEFVIYPSDRGGYSAQSVPVNEKSKETKFIFPEEWAGKTAEALQEISGIKTLSFCHNSRFLITALELEDVLRACEVTKEKSV